MFIEKEPVRVGIKGYKYDDCTIVAIGNSLGISYDLSRKILQTAGTVLNGKLTFLKSKPRTKDEFYRQSRVHAICLALSSSNNRFEINNKKKRMTVSEFSEKYSDGNYIVMADRHLTSVINGNILDTWDSGELKVIHAYRIDLNIAHEKISELANFYKMNNNNHILGQTIDELLAI